MRLPPVPTDCVHEDRCDGGRHPIDLRAEPAGQAGRHRRQAGRDRRRLDVRRARGAGEPDREPAALAGNQPGEEGPVVRAELSQVVAVMSASRKIGAVAVPLNYRLTPEEALYVINHSDAEVAYVDFEHAPMFAALRDRLEKVRHIIAVGGPDPGDVPAGMLTDADIAAAPADPPDVGDAAGTGGTMIYTSGTTGKPKGAVRSGAPD